MIGQGPLTCMGVIVAILLACGEPPRAPDQTPQASPPSAPTGQEAKEEPQVSDPLSDQSPNSQAEPEKAARAPFSAPLTDEQALVLAAEHCVRCHTAFQRLDELKKNAGASATSMVRQKKRMPSQNESWADSSEGRLLRDWFDAQ